MGKSLFKGADVSQLISYASGLTKSISFSGGVSLPKTICQNLQAQVQVNIQQVYEIGSRNAHRIMGRPTGSGSISNIMGPTKETVSGLAALCNICKPVALTVKFVNTACGGETSGGLVFKDCVCNSVSATATAAEDSISGQWGLMFSDVEQI